MQAAAQVARLFRSQAKAVADERAALLAEQYKQTEKLITAISASVNRDLPARVEAMLKREIVAMAGNVSDAFSPAIAAALEAALPQHLAGPAFQACTLPAAALETYFWPCYEMRDIEVAFEIIQV